MNILIAFGTRPEWLKVKPLIEEFKKQNIDFKVLFTGQHTDLLKNIKTDFNLVQETLCDNRLNSVLANTLIDNIPNHFTHVLVQGDTTSALGVALWAFHNKIKIIHLEAGLRTNDLDHPYPEEANRQLISRIADIHFCATEKNKLNLLADNVPHKNDIYVVGNTSLDNIKNIIPFYSNKVLITLHRRENHNSIIEWFCELEKIALHFKDLEFILPIHPNPNVYKHKSIFSKVKVIEPLEHNVLIDILKECKFVITDSGGIQEEACFLNKKIIICRETTERDECLLHHGVLCKKPQSLFNLVENFYTNYYINKECPFGSGNTSKLISDILHVK